MKNDGVFKTCLVSRAMESPQRPGDAHDPGRLPPACLVHAANWYNDNMVGWDQRVLEVGNQLVKQYANRHEWAELPDILTSDAGFGSVRGVGLEHVFPLDGSNSYCDAIHAAIAHINNSAWSYGRVLPGFLSLRFQSPSRAPLALRPGPSASVEVLTLLNDRDEGHVVLSEVEHILLQYGGRPHWGQVFGASPSIYDYDSVRVASIAASCGREIAAWVGALQAHGIETARFASQVTLDLGLAT